MSSSSTALPTRSRRLRLSPGTQAVWAFTGLIAAAAVALWLALRGIPSPDRGLSLPWWGLALGFVVTELCVVHIHFRSSAHSLTLGEIPLVLGLVFASPADVALGWVAGATVVLMIHRGPAVRMAFNLAQFALVASLAAITFWVAGGTEADGPALWAAVAAGVAASAASAPLLISAAMRLSGEKIGLSALPSMLAVAGVVAVTNASLGLAAAIVLDHDPWHGLLLLSPCVVIFIAYRAYQRERTKTTGLEFLYAAARTVAGAPSRDSGLAGMLALAIETFRAERAELLVLLPSGEHAGTRVSVGAEQGIVVGAPVSDELAAAIQALVESDAGAHFVTPADVKPALAEHFEREGIHEALIAGLPDEAGLLGAIVVANRLGAAGTFDADDRRLFETLAGHTAASLGADRLERRIADLRVTQEHLEHQAFHDALTGLANRLLFHDRVEHALSRRSGNAAVIYIDLNDFKPVNDTLGHDAGDELLKITADRLRASLRTADTPARLGGDEFAVLLTDIESDHLAVVTERIISAFAEPFPLAGKTHAITASIGVALADCGSMRGDELLRNADAAMYVTKHGGKRGYSVYGAPTIRRPDAG
jgi:diguanylate cyclase (GGDEF)-like protein